MQQKRFLTAGEVFQLFGVDSDALDKLVETGQVQALPDRGSFKYRSEDFAKLVKSGKLSPRTAGEMFQVDEDGDMPFLKLGKEDRAIKFDEEVFLLDLDEDALNEQAESSKAEARPPIVAPETWYDDDEDLTDAPSSKGTTHEGTAKRKPVKHADEKTDFEIKANQVPDSLGATDSDVRLVADDGMIDLDDPDLARSGSDSDVRLEGSISSNKRNPDSWASDSDIRLSSHLAESPGSDSDVVIVSDPNLTAGSNFGLGDSAVSLADSGIQKPDSDSDVTLSPAKTSRGNPPAASPPVSLDSDSDVVLLSSDSIPAIPAGSPSLKADSDSDVTLAGVTEGVDGQDEAESTDAEFNIIESDSDVILMSDPGMENIPKASPSGGKKRDSDSDVRLSVPKPSETLGSESDIKLYESILEAAPDSDIKLSDNEIHLDFEAEVGTEPGEFAVVDGSIGKNTSEQLPTDFTLDQTEPEFILEAVSDPEFSQQSDKTIVDSNFELDKTSIDSPAASDKTIDMPVSDSDIQISAGSSESDVLQVDDFDDSGITLDESGLDSGISLAADDDDSGITLEAVQGDSDIRLQPIDAGSGISLEGDSSDSGIMLEQSDSGIRFEPVTDSGISLIKTDSGISLMAEDSGIALEDDADDLQGAVIDVENSDFDMDGDDTSATANIDLSGDFVQDSGFDVSLSESGDTMEIASADDDYEPSEEFATPKSSPRKGGSKSMNLSEAFQLDESIEVEDLDISDDLDAAVTGSSEEFASLDEEEVLEASDEHFGEDSLSVAEDDEEPEISSKSEVKPSKRRGPVEPAWGMVTVVPIICASVVMLMTSTVLLGGMATMWKGGEVSGPAGMLISTLAGLSPW